MRISLPLPSQIFAAPSQSPSDPPLLRIGGDLVLMELQGEMTFEGDCSGQVIGVLGLERMDKPTLYLGQHHLLHGKISTLPRPLAVLRKVQPSSSSKKGKSKSNSYEVTPDGKRRGLALNDQEEEEEEEDDEDSADEDEIEIDDSAPELPSSRPQPQQTPSKPQSPSHLPAQTPSKTPSKQQTPSAIPNRLLPPAIPASPFSSSPLGPPPKFNDYSSDLEDPGSSPVKGEDSNDKLAKKRKREAADVGREEERVKEYEVVGVVRKKVVFSLRPEPIVHATILPE